MFKRFAREDRIAAIDEEENIHYYLKDHLGSTRMTIRDDGTVTGRYYRYYSFGETGSEQAAVAHRSAVGLFIPAIFI